MNTKRLQDSEVARGLDREPQRSALWSPEPSAVLGGTLQQQCLLLTQRCDVDLPIHL